MAFPTRTKTSRAAPLHLRDRHDNGEDGLPERRARVDLLAQAHELDAMVAE
jgi:hypothetical protein